MTRHTGECCCYVCCYLANASDLCMRAGAFHEKFYCFNCAIIFAAAAACKDWYQSFYIQLWSFNPFFLILWKAERLILCKNEYSNSLTRPELLPVAVFYGKTQLENVQTPPDRRPGGPQQWWRRRQRGAPIQPAPPCGGSQSPLLHKELYTLSTQTAACLLACLPAWQAGQNNKTAHTKVSFENRATRDERMYLNAFRTWL